MRVEWIDKPFPVVQITTDKGTYIIFRLTGMTKQKIKTCMLNKDKSRNVEPHNLFKELRRKLK